MSDPSDSNDQQPSPACWKQPCNEEHLARIATWITDWRAVSPFLGITEAEEIAILESTHSVPARKMAMLRKWKHKKGAGATYKRLCKAFSSCSFCDLEEKIVHLLTKHSLTTNNSSDEDEGRVWLKASHSACLVKVAGTLVFNDLLMILSF